jgi:outer membrane protein TolC
MLRRRPDVRSAELLAAAQCARIGVAKADLYPSFTLSGAIGFQASTSGGAANRLLSADNIFYSIGPRITWPFFNYGRIKNSVRVEDARFQQLLVGYRDTVLKALQEVEDAIAGFFNAQQAAAFQERSVTAARRSVELALVQYREGATDFQRVLEAERSLLSAQNALTQTSSAVTTNVVALFKALGGGWEWAQGEPILPASTIEEMRARTDWGGMLSQPARQEARESPQPVKQ